jgi:hypothetical protein
MASRDASVCWRKPYEDAPDSFENKDFAVWTYKEKRKNSRVTYVRCLAAGMIIVFK